MQEVPPPDVTEVTPPDWTSPFIPPGSEPANYTILGVIVTVIILIVAYWYYQNKVVAPLKRLGEQHFNLERFKERTQTTILTDYNRKFGMIMMVIMGAVLILPTIIANYIDDMTVRGGIILLSWGFVAVALDSFLSRMAKDEMRENQESTWIPCELHIPGQESIGRVLRRVRHEKEIKLSPEQLERMVDKVLEVAKDAEAKIPPGARKEMLAAYKRFHINKCSVSDEFKIILISKHKWKDLQNPNTEEVFDRTTEVPVTRAPMHLVYVGPTKDIFDTLDKKNLPTKAERIMGVFVAPIDRKMVFDLLVKERFESPNYRDGLFAQILYAYQQQCITADYADGKTQSLNEKSTDFDNLRFKKSVGVQAQVNTYIRGFKRLFQFEDKTDVAMSIIKQALLWGAIWYFAFSVLGMMG